MLRLMLRQLFISTLGFAGLVGIAGNTAAADLKAASYGDFDTYALALSWEPGFCKHMQNAPDKTLPVECKQAAPANKSAYLTIHGLWPGLPKSLASKIKGDSAHEKMKKWFRFGCGVRPLAFPSFGPAQKCSAPALMFSSGFKAELLAAMPGATDGSCLDRYEYAKHAVCFGFVPEDYFGAMVRIGKQVRGGKFGQFLSVNYAKSVSKDDFLAAFSADFGKQSLPGVILSCSQTRQGAFLEAVQLVIKKDQINAPLSAASFATAENGNGNCIGNFTIGAWGS